MSVRANDREYRVEFDHAGQGAIEETLRNTANQST
jgi:hypothetical protein